MIVISTGLLYTSVCSDTADPDEIERSVNMQVPTGISSPWAISTDATFADGSPHPNPCEQVPGRQHWLLSC